VSYPPTDLERADRDWQADRDWEARADRAERMFPRCMSVGCMLAAGHLSTCWPGEEDDES
jgi:hypothetical protein